MSGVPAPGQAGGGGLLQICVIRSLVALRPEVKDELSALTLDRSAIIKVVNALREYRKLVEMMRARHEMHNVWADADEAVPRIEGVEDLE